MNRFSKFLQAIEHVFKSPRVETAFAEVGTLVQIAAPIVQQIAALTPNRTVQEVTAAFNKFAVPMAVQLTGDPTQLGNALLNLATTLVQKNVKQAAAVNLIQTAVQIAVTATKAADAAG